MQSATNLFYEVNAAGGTIQVGSNSIGAALTATAGGNPRLSLVADNIATGTATSTIIATGGTVELAPYTSPTTVSLGGSSGNVFAAGVFNAMNTGTVVVGQFTDMPNASTLDTSAGDISVDGSVDLTGHAVSLVLISTGTISESTGTLVVGTLYGGGTGVSLPTAGNQIDTLGTFAASGGAFVLADTNALTVAGSVSATGSIYLQSANSGGINVTGTVASGGLVSFQAAKLGNTGTIAGTTFELAPNAGGTLTLGTSVGLTSLTGIGPSYIRIGAVTLPNGASPTTTAGVLGVGGNFGAGTITLELDSLGAISETGSNALTAATLVGQAGGAVGLGNVNTIGTLGNFTAAGLTLSNGTSLTVAGVVNAGTAATVTSSGAINESGTLIAGTLSGSAVGGANFITGSNQIGTLGTFTASGGLSLTDGSNLTVTGPVSANGITVNDGAGTITLAGGTLGSGAIAFNAGSLSQTGLTTITGTGTTTVNVAGNASFATLSASGATLLLELASTSRVTGTDITLGGPLARDLRRREWPGKLVRQRRWVWWPWRGQPGAYPAGGQSGLCVQWVRNRYERLYLLYGPVSARAGPAGDLVVPAAAV